MTSGAKRCGGIPAQEYSRKFKETQIKKSRQQCRDFFMNYVFLFFFLAAGESTLFNIKRYPGELEYKLKSVGSSPTR
jgi:hypothetical protein